MSSNKQEAASIMHPKGPWEKTVIYHIPTQQELAK